MSLSLHIYQVQQFISLRKVTDIKINGIGSGLPVEGIGMLKWPMLADNGAEMDIHIHQALYVPSAPKQNDQETVFKLSDMQGS
jgi:hypothetical protein